MKLLARLHHLVRAHPAETAVLLAIFSLGAFLRFYQLTDYLPFSGDEGRDALVLKHLLADGQFPLVGPAASVGNVFLGPAYYYLMALPMAVFWLNPVAAAAQVAVLGLGSIGLIYYLARQWFGRAPAVIAALLFAVSRPEVIFSRVSSNASPAPFFALLTVVGLYQVRQSGNYRWLILTGAALGLLVQMHYMALLMLPVVVLLWVYQYRRYRQRPDSGRHVWFGTIGAVFAFLILLSPLLGYDLGHHFANVKGFYNFFLHGQSGISSSGSPLAAANHVYNETLIGDYLAANVAWGNRLAGWARYLAPVTSVVVLVPLVVACLKRWRGQALPWPYLALGLWLAIGVLGASLFRSGLEVHYLEWLSPVPFLLLAAAWSSVSQAAVRRVRQGGLLALVGFLFITNLQHTPFELPPPKLLQRTQTVSRHIVSEAGGRPFQLVLLPGDYSDAYKFYLDRYGNAPISHATSLSDKLFVICQSEPCDPLHDPLVGARGSFVLHGQEVVDGLMVYLLESASPSEASR